MSAEAQIRLLLEELARALAALGVLPWWAYTLVVAVAIPLVFAWFHVALKWPPGWDKPNESPPFTLDKDGTLHLDQKPPEDYL